jgi:hypothetical protein
MSVMEHRIAKLEAIHGRAGNWDAVIKSLTDEDLRLAMEFVRHRLSELKSSSSTDEPDLDRCLLTGAHLQKIVAQARTWSSTV